MRGLHDSTLAAPALDSNSCSQDDGCCVGPRGGPPANHPDGCAALEVCIDRRYLRRSCGLRHPQVVALWLTAWKSCARGSALVSGRGCVRIFQRGRRSQPLVAGEGMAQMPRRTKQATFVIIGVALLVAQLVSVGYAHFGPAPAGQSWLSKTVNGCSAQPVDCRRYFAWAPNDYLVEYQLAVQVGDQTLSPADARGRYGLPPNEDAGTSTWQDPPQRLIDTIEQYERDADGASASRVVLSYQVNGGPQQVWQWPHS